MSEYPIGLNGELIHCLDDSDYAEYCRSRLEEEVNDSQAGGLDLTLTISKERYINNHQDPQY